MEPENQKNIIMGKLLAYILPFYWQCNNIQIYKYIYNINCINWK